MNYAVGSIWNKWDLHVHTPASFEHRFQPGGATDPWEAYLAALASLPREFKVIGINDYLFIDGYRRVRDAHRIGLLPNIDLVLPVIELRLDKFGGTATALSKVNYHVIFSDVVDPDVIQLQFINRLHRKYDLGGGKVWDCAPSVDSLRKLGELIHAEAPNPADYAGKDPLLTGFANITFPLEIVAEALSASDLRNGFVTAVGKTEWADVKWTAQGIADKKSIINSADIVFVASASVPEYERAKAALTKAAVNDLLLDCSDAHAYANALDKDRLGNCWTWIKADTTFEGLKHALREPSERIFVGDVPPKLRTVALNTTKYIREVRLSKVQGSPLQERWFDQQVVPLNLDLVAIIGNKGQGKSALADVVGLAGNSKQDRYYSFLQIDKFRDPKANEAKHFEATVRFESGSTISRRLDAAPDQNAVALVRYLPQNYIERLCNEIAAGPHTDFDRELKNIIFSHVPEENRLRLDSLDAVLTYRTKETKDAIDLLKRELSALNRDILGLEQRTRAAHRTALEKALALKEAELAAHDASAPAPVTKPDLDPQTQQHLATVREQLEKGRARQTELVTQRAQLIADQSLATQKIAACDKVLGGLRNLVEQFRSFEHEYAAALESIGLKTADVVILNLKQDVATKMRVAYETTATEVKAALSAVDAERASLATELATAKAQLDEPTRQYEAYLSAREEWEARRLDIVGAVAVPDSLEYIKAQIAELPELPAKLAEMGERRRKLTRNIFERIAALAGVYREMYAAVQDFIDTHSVARDKFQLKFHVSIIDRNFREKFVDLVNRGVAGSFCGIEESDRLLGSLISSRDFSVADDVVGFADTIVDHLRADLRTYAQGQPIELASQLRKGHTPLEVYDFVYGLDYLEPQYSLRMGTKDVAQLSPGEKGALLLVFYLLVDKGDVPLIIDQPEGNLDNETIVDLLVPSIKEAKKRRQVFIVTHNPNLAVVCDADQVIWATLDKAHDHLLTYTTGALENPVINKKVVDILEGTQPAFDNRDSKYLR